MNYELWDVRSANLMGVFTSEDAALAFVREIVAEHGPKVITTWALAHIDSNGHSTELARGPALRRRIDQVSDRKGA